MGNVFVSFISELTDNYRLIFPVAIKIEQHDSGLCTAICPTFEVLINGNGYDETMTDIKQQIVDNYKYLANNICSLNPKQLLKLRIYAALLNEPEMLKESTKEIDYVV